MFLRRLTWFWILLTSLALLLVGRLAEIQVVRADDYQDLAARLLTRPVRYPRAPRGRILDRGGHVLVSDQPCADVGVHYALLGGQNASYLRAVARQLRERGEFPRGMRDFEIVPELRQEIDDLWPRLAEITGRPVAEFAERAERVRSRVQRIRAQRRAATDIDEPVREETWLHPLAEDIGDEAALAVRLELENRPWLRVVPGSRRVVQDATAVVHLLGRLGAVSARDLEDDLFRGDELRELQPNDRCGASGIEKLAEPVLRGIRGRVVEEMDGREIERLPAQPGGDVTLAIDLPLQEHVLELLAEAVDGSGEERPVVPAGGAAVVLDVATREVLALVSYPVYDQARLGEEYERLRRDPVRSPLRFRAVSSQYPPGSTCKAITLVGALSDGLTTPHERVSCTGHLLPEQPTVFRCWIYNQYQTTHDAAEPAGQAAADAIRNSCNIYFFKMGGRLGPQRLCEWFSQFGLGRLQGTGLIEESPALVPSERRLRRKFQASDAWNYAIGQGEVTATPLQVANVAATIAAGQWAPVRLLRTSDRHLGGGTELERRAIPPEPLRVLRTGMWRVVNEPGGTAYKYARLAGDLVLCGKTGSAEATPVPVSYRYTFEWPDGRRAEVEAYLEEDALAQFPEPRPKRIGRWAAQQQPELEAGEPLPSHAWFMGFTQPAGTPRGAVPTGPVYALSVVIEFGGSGGRIAGPVARRIAEYLAANPPAP